jgi:hypothetical protein
MCMACILTCLLGISGLRWLIQLNEAFEWLAVVIPISEISGSILGININYPDQHTFPFLSNWRLYLRFRPFRLWKNTLWFVWHRRIATFRLPLHRLRWINMVSYLRLIYVANGVVIYIVMAIWMHQTNYSTAAVTEQTYLLTSWGLSSLSVAWNTSALYTDSNIVGYQALAAVSYLVCNITQLPSVKIAGLHGAISQKTQPSGSNKVSKENNYLIRATTMNPTA